MVTLPMVAQVSHYYQVLRPLSPMRTQGPSKLPLIFSAMPCSALSFFKHREETLGLCGVTLHYLYAALVDEVGRLA
jgi:hypothetical protein